MRREQNLPPGFAAVHEARIQAHAARVASDLEGQMHLAMGRPRKEKPAPAVVKRSGRQPRPVISDLDEWFESGLIAAQAFGKGRGTICMAAARGSVSVGRRWRFATKAETAAANKQSEVAA